MPDEAFASWLSAVKRSAAMLMDHRSRVQSGWTETQTQAWFDALREDFIREATNDFDHRRVYVTTLKMFTNMEYGWL